MTYDLSEANVTCVGGPAKLFGLRADRYFAEIMDQPGLDIAGHSHAFVRLAQRLPVDAVIVDIGANIGLTVLIGSRLVPEGRVIAVEPAPMAQAALQKTKEANALANCTIVHKGIGNTFGSVPFVEDGEFLAGSYIGTDTGAVALIDVPIITLDGLVMMQGLERVDLVKVDVEGYELDVLKGGLGTIEKFDPTFVMEFNAFALTANRDISPVELLNFIIDRFGAFQVIRQQRIETVSNRKEMRDFVYSHMVNYWCVEDIIFGRPISDF